MRKIIVITPVKNEVWILRRFLTVTSRFADIVIIADQQSTDGSQEIYAEFSNVHVIKNGGNEYDENQRQRLLLDAARDLVPGEKVILALDADEIFAATAINSAQWQMMREAKKGTIFYFEKPLLYRSPDKCLRFRNDFYPLGFVDDGSEHTPKKIHSIRIPVKADAPRMYLDELVVLHYAVTRPDCQRAKCRMYAILENIHGTIPFYQRIYGYGRKYFLNYGIKVENTPAAWFKEWEEKGIDMKTIQQSDYYWNDLEVLRMFKKYGTKKFWIEDIWDGEWEKIIEAEKGKGNNEFEGIKIDRPPYYYNFFYWSIATAFRIRKKLFPNTAFR